MGSSRTHVCVLLMSMLMPVVMVMRMWLVAVCSVGCYSLRVLNFRCHCAFCTSDPMSAPKLRGGEAIPARHPCARAQTHRRPSLSRNITGNEPGCEQATQVISQPHPCADTVGLLRWLGNLLSTRVATPFNIQRISIQLAHYQTEWLVRSPRSRTNTLRILLKEQGS